MIIIASSSSVYAGGYASFSAIYVGDTDPMAVSTFRDMLSWRGWTQELYKDGFNSSMLPYHYHFTNGIYDNGFEAANDSDILFVAGHGQRNATIWMKHLGQDVPSENVGADTKVNKVVLPYRTDNPPPWEVGIEWVATYQNESRWDQLLKWVIFGACSQLDRYNEYYTYYDDGTLNTGPTPSVFGTAQGSAKTWARTLLGTPNRAHMILGYYRGAPGSEVMKNRIETFIYEATNGGRKVIDAWAYANDPPGGATSNWAIVTHVANKDDYLLSINTGPTPNTPTTSSYMIDYYRQNVVNRVLDGRGGGYETISDAGFIENSKSKTKWGSLVAFAKGIILGNNNELNIANKPTSNLNVKQSPKKDEYYYKNQLPGKKDVKGLQLVSKADNTKIINHLFSGVSPQNVTDSKNNSVKEYKNGKASLKVYPSGAVLYDRGDSLSSEKINISVDEAIQTAKNYIKENYSVPDGIEVYNVHEITKTRLNLDSEEDGPTEVVEYKVNFRKKYDETNLEGNSGEFVSVKLDNKGIRGYERHMNEYSVSLFGGNNKTFLISPEQAIDSFVEKSDFLLDLPDDGFIQNVTQVYYSESFDKESPQIIPAWKISVDNTNYYVDARNGKLLRE